jgi:hypothetical protein
MRDLNKSDWCTLFPDRFLWWDWSSCCKEHDEDYFDVSSLPYDKEFFRQLVDEELKICVNKILPGLGDIMYLGVRVFGRFFIK